MDDKNASTDVTPAEDSGLTGVPGGGEEKTRRGRRPIKPLAKPVYRVLSESELDIPYVDDAALVAIAPDKVVAGEKEIAASPAAPIDIPKPPVPVKAKKRPTKAILAALVCVALIFLVYQSRYTIIKMISPQKYMEMVTVRTTVGFQKELQTFMKNNLVAKQYNGIVGKPSRHVLTFESPSMGFGSLDIALELQNDNQKKQLMVSSTIPAIGDVAFYLSNKSGMVSIMGENYSFDPQSAKKELTTFLDNNMIGYEDEIIPSDLDISYSALEKLVKTMQIGEVSAEYQRLSERYTREIAKLLEAGQYRNESKETVEIGEKSVKAKAVSVTFKEETVLDWLSDLADTVEDDAQLKAAMSVFGYYAYDELCSSVRDAAQYYTGDFTVTALTVKDRVVVVRVHYKDGYRQSYAFEAGAVGETYRLDSLYANARGAGNNVGIKIWGNHIGKGVFSSKISVKNRQTSTFQIRWDPEKEKNNISVSVMNLAGFQATAAIEGSKVIVKPGDSDAVGYSLFWREDLFSYTAQPLKENILWPKNADKLENLYIDELIGMMSYY